MQTKNVKLVVFVPEANADTVRQVMGDAGAGIIGNYSHCSFSSKGFGRFVPKAGANPTIGEVGKPEMVAEERIEVLVAREKIEVVVAAMKSAHPYEEVAFDIYPVEN